MKKIRVAAIYLTSISVLSFKFGCGKKEPFRGPSDGSGEQAKERSKAVSPGEAARNAGLEDLLLTFRPSAPAPLKDYLNIAADPNGIVWLGKNGNSARNNPETQLLLEHEFAGKDSSLVAEGWSPYAISNSEAWLSNSGSRSVGRLRLIKPNEAPFVLQSSQIPPPSESSEAPLSNQISPLFLTSEGAVMLMGRTLLIANGELDAANSLQLFNLDSKDSISPLRMGAFSFESFWLVDLSKNAIVLFELDKDKKELKRTKTILFSVSNGSSLQLEEKKWFLQKVQKESDSAPTYVVSILSATGELWKSEETGLEARKLSFEADIVPIVRRACGECHVNAAFGGWSKADQISEWSPARRNDILARIESAQRPMPPKNTKEYGLFSEQDKLILKNFIQAQKE
jgi:hypothetical protein